MATEADLPSSPIPLALGPTSRIDQLDHSPPHPAEAFSPSPPTAPFLLDRGPSPPPLPTPAPVPTKPHPADLVSLEHPDPHAHSTPGTPRTPDSPYSPTESSDLHDPHGHGHGLDGSTTTHGGRGSENGVALSHGSEHDHPADGGTTLPPPPPPTHDAPREEDEEVVAVPATNGRVRRSSSSVVGDGEHDLVPDNSLSTADGPPAPITQPSFVPTVPAVDGTSTAAAAAAAVAAPPAKTRERSKPEARRDKDKDRDKDKERESTRSRRVLGEWTMSKTLGAGSMGKVKLGISSVTGEKVRVVFPR